MVERQVQVQMLEQPRVRSDTCHHGYISLGDDAHIFSSLLCFWLLLNRVSGQWCLRVGKSLWASEDHSSFPSASLQSIINEIRLRMCNKCVYILCRLASAILANVHVNNF